MRYQFDKISTIHIKGKESNAKNPRLAKLVMLFFETEE
jgi:hypothetical protein